jgi:hypothetical protein
MSMNRPIEFSIFFTAPVTIALLRNFPVTHTYVLAKIYKRGGGWCRSENFTCFDRQLIVHVHKFEFEIYRLYTDV